jgi:motility quorum-sensing regulator/GCU-specific mRNA interferase toxin
VDQRTPHYDLAPIQADVARLGAAAFTKTALDGGRQMGLILRRSPCLAGCISRVTPVKKLAYIKITLRDAAPVIQFKEK